MGGVSINADSLGGADVAGDVGMAVSLDLDFAISLDVI